MTDNITAGLIISGHFPGCSFPEWIFHRATKLSLVGWVKIIDEHHIEVQVSGHRILVDAFETACNLGPMDVTVDTIDVQRRRHCNSVKSFKII